MSAPCATLRRFDCQQLQSGSRACVQLFVSAADYATNPFVSNTLLLLFWLFIIGQGAIRLISPVDSV
jgi:hypothetical protein